MAFDMLIPKCTWNCKGRRIAKTINNEDGGLKPPDPRLVIKLQSTVPSSLGVRKGRRKWCNGTESQLSPFI